MKKPGIDAVLMTTTLCAFIACVASEYFGLRVLALLMAAVTVIVALLAFLEWRDQRFAVAMRANVPTTRVEDGKPREQ